MSPPLLTDRSDLAEVVSRVLGTGPVEIVDWRCTPMQSPFNQTTARIERINGTALTGNGSTTWSVVRKGLQCTDDAFGGTEDPSGASYWKREALIYRSGLLNELPGIVAPRCYRIDELDDATVWLWLEDVPDVVGSVWTAAHVAVAGRRLGAFNGAYLAGRPLPDESCVSRDWLRSSVTGLDASLGRVAELRDHPLVHRCWPGDLLDRLRYLHATSARLLGALDRLPQTFCHLDAFSRNLRCPDDTKVVALDWSFAGIAPVGAELAALVAAGACLYDAPVDQLPEFETAALDGYVDGLRGAGWDGDPECVRLGYCATVALRFGLFPMGLHLLDPTLAERFERLFRRPVDTIADQWASIARFLLDRGAEAEAML